MNATNIEKNTKDKQLPDQKRRVFIGKLAAVAVVAPTAVFLMNAKDANAGT
jgi:hypothetical protein